MFFEKELLYCKLTVASNIRKELLHVSFGAVGSWSFCVLKQGLINLGTFQKALIWFVRMYYLCVLIRGLQNLESSLKGFNCCGAKMSLRWAESRFSKPRSFLQRGRFYILFASCKKNQKARQRFANLWTPGTIQSSAGSDFAKLSGGSCRNRFCPQNGGEKALNRCERVTVVQTQD